MKAFSAKHLVYNVTPLPSKSDAEARSPPMFQTKTLEHVETLQNAPIVANDTTTGAGSQIPMSRDTASQSSISSIAMVGADDPSSEHVQTRGYATMLPVQEQATKPSELNEDERLQEPDGRAYHAKALREISEVDETIFVDEDAGSSGALATSFQNQFDTQIGITGPPPVAPKLPLIHDSRTLSTTGEDATIRPAESKLLAYRPASTMSSPTISPAPKRELASWWKKFNSRDKKTASPSDDSAASINAETRQHDWYVLGREVLQMPSENIAAAEDMDASKHKSQNVREQDADIMTRHELAFGDGRRMTLDDIPHIIATEQAKGARLHATWHMDERGNSDARSILPQPQSPALKRKPVGTESSSSIPTTSSFPNQLARGACRRHPRMRLPVRLANRASLSSRRPVASFPTKVGQGNVTKGH